MALPTISGEARLTEDPTLRFSASGVAVASVSLAFNSRKLNKDTNTWEDGDVFYVRGTVFKDAAENIVESLNKGDAVTVTGRLKTDQWEDKDGNKRSAASLLIDSIGPSLARATARVTKASRDGVGQPAARQQSADDPWATQPSTRQAAGDPPF